MIFLGIYFQANNIRLPRSFVARNDGKNKAVVIAKEVRLKQSVVKIVRGSFYRLPRHNSPYVELFLTRTIKSENITQDTFPPNLQE